MSQIRLDSISTSHPISWTKRSKVSATFVIKKIKLQSYATRKPFSESARTKYQLRSRVRSNLTASVPSSFFFSQVLIVVVSTNRTGLIGWKTEQQGGSSELGNFYGCQYFLVCSKFFRIVAATICLLEWD